MFQSSACTKTRTIFAYAALPVRRLEVHKKLGVDTARTADPDWPKRCSIPYNIKVSDKSWSKEEGRRGCSES